MNQSIKDVYYDPTEGFSSADKLYRNLREKGINVKRSDVAQFLKDQYTWQVNKQQKKPKIWRTIVAKYPGENYQMDVMIYNRFEINHYKYILNCIDVYSRYAMAIPLTNLRVNTLLDAIKEIFQKMGKPKNLNFDQQFSNPKILTDYFEEEGITLYASETGELNKNAIVERFNLTLANLLQRWRSAQSSKLWYKVLPTFMENYNNTYHKTIKAKPIDVWDRKEMNHQKIVYLPTKISVGDQVRVKVEKKTFDKGDAIKFSDDIYVVKEQKKLKYLLENLRTGKCLSRMYKDYELQLVKNIVRGPVVPQPTREAVEAPRMTKTAKRKAAKEVTDYLQPGKHYREPLPSKRISKKK